jgi:hypothetical protein
MSRPRLAINEFSSLNPERDTSESAVFNPDKIDA